MLVLTRKQNEQIQIGDDILLTVLRVKGNTVRIGIDAPSSVRVVRGELPRETRPKYKEITLMMTDPQTGEVSEQWNSRAQSTPQAPRTERVSNEADDRQERRIAKEVNRLHEIVDRVSRDSWSFDTPSAQSY